MATTTKLIRMWTKTLRKLDHLCGLDHRRMRTEEIDWLVDAELKRREIDPETLESAKAGKVEPAPAGVTS